MKKRNIYLLDSIQTLYKNKGTYMLSEQSTNIPIYRPFTKTEYSIFKKKLGFGVKIVNNLKTKIKLNEEYILYLSRVNKVILFENKRSKKLLVEGKINKLNRKLTIPDLFITRSNYKKLLKEYEDVKVVNPETGREILARSAISGGVSHPAYKVAKKALSGKKDDHGHDDHYDEESSREIVVGAVTDTVMKALHLQGAGVIGKKLTKGAKNLRDRFKGAEGDSVLSKMKNVSKDVKKEIKGWREDKKAAFIASITDEDTGVRKGFGSILKQKGKKLLKTAKDAIVHEAQHIGHGLKEGAQFAKKALTDPKNLTDEDWKKAAKGFEAACHVGIVGVAIGAGIASGGVLGGAMALGSKSSQIAARDGGLTALLTAHIYTDLERSGKLKLIGENTYKRSLQELIILTEIKKVNENVFLEKSGELISEGLTSEEKPSEKFNEDDMKDISKSANSFIDLDNEIGKKISSKKE